jgi:hypothetical protein
MHYKPAFLWPFILLNSLLDYQLHVIQTLYGPVLAHQWPDQESGIRDQGSDDAGLPVADFPEPEPEPEPEPDEEEDTEEDAGIAPEEVPSLSVFFDDGVLRLADDGGDDDDADGDIGGGDSE